MSRGVRVQCLICTTLTTLVRLNTGFRSIGLADEFYLRLPGGFAATTPLVSRKLPPSTSAGPSRVAKKGRAVSALSISSDDGDIQEVTAKANKRGVRVANPTGTTKRGRRQDNGSDEAEILQSEHETKKKRIRRAQEEIGDESEPEAEIQEVPPLASTKRTRGSSRKPASGVGKGAVNGTTRGKGKGKARAKAAAPMAVDEIESLEIEEEDARMEVANLAAAINASLTPTKQEKMRTKQASRVADKVVDDECARLREQLRQVRFLADILNCLSDYFICL